MQDVFSRKVHLSKRLAAYCVLAVFLFYMNPRDGHLAFDYILSYSYQHKPVLPIFQSNTNDLPIYNFHHVAP